MNKTRRYLLVPAAPFGLSGVLADCQSGDTGGSGTVDLAEIQALYRPILEG